MLTPITSFVEILAGIEEAKSWVRNMLVLYVVRIMLKACVLLMAVIRVA